MVINKTTKSINSIESQSKEKLEREIDNLIIRYNSLFLNNRENKEKIRKKLEKVWFCSLIHKHRDYRRFAYPY